MTTVFVDLVNLDGSRPEGTLRFSLERLVLGDPDIVPSAVEVKIRDGKARVENLLPGAMRVRVNAGCWSKDWQVSIPAEGEHDLFALLGEQAPEFEHALYATLLGRVEKLEQVPPVDLAPVEQRLDALESRPEPQPFDPTGLEEADKKLGERLEVLENQPAPQPFDPSALETQLADMQAKLTAMPNFTPVNLLDGSYEPIDWDSLSPIYEVGGDITATAWMGRVNITISARIEDYTIKVFEDGLNLVGFPNPINTPEVPSTVWLQSETSYLPGEGGTISAVYRDEVLNIKSHKTVEASSLRKALEDGYTQLRIEIEYFTTDTV